MKISQAFWAMVDQSLFAAAHFFGSLLLARWLSAEQFGIFSFVYALFLFVATFHTTVVAEPALVFGSGEYRRQWRAYLDILWRLHWRVSLWLAAVLGGALGVYSMVNPQSDAAVATLIAVVAPLILWMWLCRRLCYVVLGARWAAVGGAVYCMVLLVALTAAQLSGGLTIAVAIACLGLASAVVAAGLSKRLGAGVPADDAVLTAEQVWGRHWSYGSWNTLAASLAWVPANVYYLGFVLHGKTAQSAELRAAMILILPVMHVFTALAPLLIKEFTVRRRRAVRRRGYRQRMTAVFVAVALVYGLLLLFFGPSWMTLMYEGKYHGSTALMSALALLGLVSAVATVYSSVLRSYGRTRVMSGGFFGAALVALTVGLWLADRWGVAGAVAAHGLSVLTAAIVLYGAVRRNGDG